DRSPVARLDLAVFGLGLVALAYLLGAGFWFGLDLPIAAQLYGFRDAVYFSLLYFVGRATPEVVRDERVLKALFLFGVVTSAAAGWLLARRRAAVAWLGYGVLWLGLLLTITRMTIVACLLQALAIAATRRRWGLITAVGSVAMLAFGCALLVVPELATYIWETV